MHMFVVMLFVELHLMVNLNTPSQLLWWLVEASLTNCKHIQNQIERLVRRIIQLTKISHMDHKIVAMK